MSQPGLHGGANPLEVAARRFDGGGLELGQLERLEEKRVADIASTACRIQKCDKLNVRYLRMEGSVAHSTTLASITRLHSSAAAPFQAWQQLVRYSTSIKSR
jgi:hypothetical protein